MNDTYNTQSYERILKPKKSLKTCLPRAWLILGYLFFLSLWLVLIARFNEQLLKPGTLILIPLSLLLVILPTWKYGSVEHEYILSGGMFYYAKVYGKRKRKQLLALDLSCALLIAPYDEAHQNNIEALAPQSTLLALADPSADDIWVLIYKVEKKENSALLFHADDRTLRCLRQANPHAMVRSAGR